MFIYYSFNLASDMAHSASDMANVVPDTTTADRASNTAITTANVASNTSLTDVVSETTTATANVVSEMMTFDITDVTDVADVPDADCYFIIIIKNHRNIEKKYYIEVNRNDLMHINELVQMFHTIIDAQNAEIDAAAIVAAEKATLAISSAA